MPALGSTLERTFDTYWTTICGPELVAEHRFAPPRRWRTDRAHVGARVAIELEGGVWSGGRHTRGAGFEKDCEKYNALSADGWLLWRFTAGMLERDPVGCLAPVLAAIQERTA